jgi:hypothetical protein
VEVLSDSSSILQWKWLSDSSSILQWKWLSDSSSIPQWKWLSDSSSILQWKWLSDSLSIAVEVVVRCRSLRGPEPRRYAGRDARYGMDEEHQDLIESIHPSEQVDSHELQTLRSESSGVAAPPPGVPYLPAGLKLHGSAHKRTFRDTQTGHQCTPLQIDRSIDHSMRVVSQSVRTGSRVDRQ